MSNLYWAIKLTKDSKAKLLKEVKPIHNKIYAEHITIVYLPTQEQENKLHPLLGQLFKFKVVGEVSDAFGQAVVISGCKRLDNQTPHITISCADKVAPVYSNKLIQNNKITDIKEFELEGYMSIFTKKGKWFKGD